MLLVLLETLGTLCETLKDICFSAYIMCLLIGLGCIRLMHPPPAQGSTSPNYLSC